MPRTILGKVSLTPKGEYSPDTAYTALDVVSYGGNSWLALQDVTGVAPVEGENWMLLAQKGDQGASFTRLEKTAGTGAPGTIDTYTAYNSEGQEAGTVKVYQGMDGTGAGDFKADGTVPMTGDLQMGNHKLTGLAEGTADTDGVNKEQMDAAIAALTGEDIPTSGTDETTIAAALSNKAEINAVFCQRPIGGDALNAPYPYLYTTVVGPGTFGPRSDYWYVEYYPFDAHAGIQIITSPTGGDRWIRTFNFDSPGDWVQIATATPPQEYGLPLAEGVSGTIRYSKDQMGVVRLLGQVELATNQSGIIGIGTLPEGFYLEYAVATVCCGWPDGGANIAPCTAVVNADGVVAINAFDASLKVFAVNVSFGG